jgi:hypothetical protein
VHNANRRRQATTAGVGTNAGEERRKEKRKGRDGEAGDERSEAVVDKR